MGTAGQHGTRRRSPARVLTVPPPGGPSARAGAGRYAPPVDPRQTVLPGTHRAPAHHRGGPPPGGPPPRRGAPPPSHRRQTVHLTRRGWFVVRFAFGVVMTAVIGTTWTVAGHGGSSAAAAKTPLAAQPLRTTTPLPAAAATQLRADGVPVVVANAVAAAGGTLSVAVYDATGHRAWAYQDAQGVEASVSKLQLMGAELQAVGDDTPSTSTRTYLTEMIENSSNTAADAIFGRVKRSGVTAFAQAVGATTVVPDDSGEFGLDTSTAADQVAVMKAFAYPNAVVSDANRARANALLANVESDQRWGASGGVPAGVQVWIKNGWLPHGTGWVVNSVAHVQGDGRDYVVALMSSGSSTEQVGIDKLAAVSATVWASAAS